MDQPQTNPPHATFATRERHALREFLPLVERRAKDEASIKAKLDADTLAADRAHKAALAEADRLHALALSVAEAAHREEAEEARVLLEQQSQAASATHETELARFRERTTQIEAAAQQDLEDSAWLAETVVESSERKLTHDHAQSQRQLAAITTDLDNIRREGESLLVRFGTSAAAWLAMPADDSPQSVAQEADAARTQALAALDRLSRAAKPQALQLPVVFVVATMSAALGSLLGAYAVGPESIRSALAGAGLGLAAAFVALLIIRLSTRRRVKPAALALATALHQGESAAKARQHALDADRIAQLEQIRAKRDAELRKAKDRFSMLRAEVQHRRRVDEPALVQRLESILTAARRRTEQSLAEANEAKRLSVDRADRQRESAIEAANHQRDAARAHAHAAFDAARATLARQWADGLAAFSSRLDALHLESERLSPRWADGYGAAYRPALVAPPAIRLGDLTLDLSQLPGGLPADPAFQQPHSPIVRLPAMLDLVGNGSLMIQAGPDARESAIKALENTLLRLLTAFPPGKARFTIIDPVGLGQSFAGFMHLADYEEALVGDKIWTDPRRIEQKLQDLTDHMENVIQKYLRNEFATIQDYNREAGEVAEPFRFLVIADFPAGLSEGAAKRLASIASSGPRCGVYTLIHVDTRSRPPAWAPMDDLEKNSLVLAHKQGRFILNAPDFSSLALTLEKPPADDDFTKLIHAIGRFAKDCSKVQVPFEVVAPQPAQRWSADASEVLRVPVGRAGATKLQHISLGLGTAQHALIAGRTGSGKSTLLHAFITNLALWYSPSEVEFYLVDFKKGVEFKTYATHRVPHARVVAVESEREFGLSVLRRLDAELARRGQLFREAGVQDLAAYRRFAKGAGLGRVPTSMPRTLLIVDEFQEFFVEDDKVAQEATLLLDRLVRQGRAFGIHVILGSQTVGGAYSLARSTIGQMGVRIALQCSEADSYLILSEDNPAARLLSRPGEAIYNDASGLVEGNSPFQVVWLPEEKRDRYLRDVTDLASKLDTRPELHFGATIVFEGAVPSDLAQNQFLAESIRTGRPVLDATPRAWLGEAISIKDPTHVPFPRQSGSNLVLVGQQEGSAQALLVSSLLSLAAAHAAPHPADRPNNNPAPLPRFTILDPGVSDDGKSTPLAELAASLTGHATLANPRTADDALRALYAQLAARRAGEQSDAPRLYLLINGLHRFRTLRRADEFSSFGSDNDEPSTPDQLFLRLIREGPAWGIHAIVWCDTTPNLERCVERRALRDFDHKVAFQMSAQDSTNFIDTPQAVNLGRYRALYMSEELGQIEKFRPYSLPPREWLDAVAKRLVASSIAANRES